MTHALHNMLSIDTQDADATHVLAREVLLTCDEIQKEGKPCTEKLRVELTRAASLLAESGTLDALPSLASTAVVTGDPELYEVTTQSIEDKYPTDTRYAISNFTNKRLREDYFRAMKLMAERRIPMSQALGLAGDIGDATMGEHLALASLDYSLGHNAKQTIEKKFALEVARIEARQELEAKGVMNADQFDDAVPYDPFADDEDEENAA